MEKNEYLKLRKDLLDESKDEDGVFSEEYFLSNILPDLQETKLIDSEDLTFAYLKSLHENVMIKNNASCINETGERLQLFIVDDTSTSWSTKEDKLLIPDKKYYDDLFNQSTRLIKKSIKRHLELLDSDPASFLVSQFGNSDFLNQIDVIEIFLVSATIPIESRSSSFSHKRLKFNDEFIKTKITKNRESTTKEILVLKKLIDLNYLYDLSVSKGDKHPLVVNIEEVFNRKLEVLKAADENNFESYLCVIPARGLADLYRRYSTRLLEKNVRSFLQFKGANKGMRDTISNTPERFIAYNNGLTITSSSCEVEEVDNKLYLKSLQDFQIVNGGQTTASIFFSQKQGLDISKISLMAKINIAKNLDEDQINELISNISLYSNSQSKVNNVDKKTSDPKIDKIKSLSNSVMTAEGNKWFFEKLRGEFRTMILIKGGNKNKVEKEYPKERRLTKTEIGKYYTAWGLQPWLVKKGGEKVFGYFLNHISGNGKKKDEIAIDRLFYEELISKAILFRQLEIIHGTRNSAIGQLRAAVIPYSISILYLLFEGTAKRPSKFNLNVIWRDQKLPDDLKTFMLSLMKRMYLLIDRYKTSDDISENTKKEELWDRIKKSKEIKEISNSADASFLRKKYSKDEELLENDYEVDFNYLGQLADLHYHGKLFYKELEFRVASNDLGLKYLPNMFSKLYTSLFPNSNKLEDLSESTVKYFNNLILDIRAKSPSVLEELESEENEMLPNTLDIVIKIYNKAIVENINIVDVFNSHSTIAENKSVKFVPGILRDIGNKLSLEKVPSINQIFLLSSYYFKKKDDSKLEDVKVSSVLDKYLEDSVSVPVSTKRLETVLKPNYDKNKKRDYLVLLDSVLEKGSNYWDALHALSKQSQNDLTTSEIELINLGYQYFHVMKSKISTKELIDVFNLIDKLESRFKIGEILNLSDKYPKIFPPLVKFHDWVINKSIEDLIKIKTKVVISNSKAKVKYLSALKIFDIDTLNYEDLNLNNLRYLAWAVKHYSSINVEEDINTKSYVETAIENSIESDDSLNQSINNNSVLTKIEPRRKRIIKGHNNKNPKLKYLKKIVSQDIDRTPSLSVEAATKFFGMDDSPMEFDTVHKGKAYSCSISKRNTRNEYRFFITSLKNKIKFKEGDFIIFYMENDRVNVEYIKNNMANIIKITALDSLMEGENHKVIKR